MGESVIIYGKSGSGKSRSLINFGEDEIFLVNVIGKRLPFRSKFKYTINTDSISKIKSGLKKMPTKTAVIDDAGYLMTNAFMRGHSAPRSGSSSFDLFNSIADDFWGLLTFIKEELPEDIIVYITLHEDTNDFGETKIRTIGKLLSEKVCIEGMATIVLRCVVRDGKHLFLTQSDGSDISKSPESMFELEIDNDLKAADKIIREFWGFNMAGFETGISGYIKGTYTAEIYFPVDLRGNAHINCTQCYYFNSNTNRCRLNGEVCQFPDKYVGGNCPLDIEAENE